MVDKAVRDTAEVLRAALEAQLRQLPELYLIPALPPMQVLREMEPVTQRAIAAVIQCPEWRLLATVLALTRLPNAAMTLMQGSALSSAESASGEDSKTETVSALPWLTASTIEAIQTRQLNSTAPSAMSATPLEPTHAFRYCQCQSCRDLPVTMRKQISLRTRS